jgi:NADPH:quinone reductase-like Zn-dependent oxidoreductase
VKAIQAAKRGGYDALRLADIPRPQPRAGQALVRVTSAGVTPLDYTVLAGLHPRAVAPPLVPGNEGAGVVIEDPSGRFSAGERVLFFAGPGGVAEDGTVAEMTSVPSGNLAPLPGEIPDEIAGGLPVAYEFPCRASSVYRVSASWMPSTRPAAVPVSAARSRPVSSGSTSDSSRWPIDQAARM